MKYYFLKVSYTSYCCKTIYYNLVISESISRFILRHKDNPLKSEDDEMLIDFYSEISQSEYLKLHKFNPTNEGYLTLSKTDYSKFYKS